MYLFYNVILLPDLSVDTLFLKLLNPCPSGGLIGVAADIDPGNAIVEAAIHLGVWINALCGI